MDKMINERGDYWHPDPDKDRKLGGPGANQRAREDRAAASKPKSDPKKLRKGESYMDYAKRHGYKSPKKKSLLGRLGLRKEHHQKDAKGNPIEHGDGTPSSVEEKIKYDKSGSSMDYFLGADPKKTEYYKKNVKKKTKKEEVEDVNEISMPKNTSYARMSYKKLKGTHKDFKNMESTPPRVAVLDKKTGGTVSKPVKFVPDKKPKSVKEGKGYQPEIEHSKLGDAAKKKAEKKRKAAADSLPPHLRLDVMKKAFAHTNESNEETLDEKCWKGYKKKGMKTMFGKRYPNCVKANEENEIEEGIGDMAIKAIQKTNPPYLSKRSKLIRDIKLKQLKSYLKKQDEAKAKAKMKKS